MHRLNIILLAVSLFHSCQGFWITGADSITDDTSGLSALEESVIDRLLQVFGFRKNVCPFGVDAFVQDPTATDFELRYLVCSPHRSQGCPSGYSCDRSRKQGFYICCSDPLSTDKKPRLPLPTEEETSGSWSNFFESSTSSAEASTTTESSPTTERRNPWDKEEESTEKKNPWERERSTEDPWRPREKSTEGGNPWDRKTTEAPKQPWEWERTTHPEKPWEPREKSTEKTERPENPWDRETSPTAEPWFPQETTTKRSRNRWGQPEETEDESGEGDHFHPKPETTTTAAPEEIPSWRRSSTTTTEKPANGSMPDIIIVTQGSWKELGTDEYEISTSLTLVHDEGKWILVDTGVPADTNTVVRELSRHNLRPDSIDWVLLTNTEPSHSGNLNLFATKEQIYGDWQYANNVFKRTKLSEAQIRKLTSNTEIWKTPGSTQDDLSLVVKNVQHYGTVAIVGDLIINEDELNSSTMYANLPVWNSKVKQLNQKTVICSADWIVPGHGIMFKVKPDYKIAAGCKPSNFAFSPFSHNQVWYHQG